MLFIPINGMPGLIFLDCIYRAAINRDQFKAAF
jgi:hypothetical protein